VHAGSVPTVHVVILSLSVDGHTPASETFTDAVPVDVEVDAFDGWPVVVPLPAVVVEPPVVLELPDDEAPLVGVVDDVLGFITDGALLSLLQPDTIDAATNDTPPRTSPVIRTILMTVSPLMNALANRAMLKRTIDGAESPAHARASAQSHYRGGIPCVLQPSSTSSFAVTST
jgi:hypothetical protein